jgi:hypothetical protein
MKSLKLYVIIAAAVIIIVVAGFLLVKHLSDVEEQDSWQDVDDIEEQDSREETAVSNTNLSPAKQTVLNIDGKGNSDVYLQSLDIQVEVTGNIASTRHTMIFKNKTDRVLEGDLTFPLPDGLSVTYYALDINGKMREAVPVEKARATEVFEEIEQRQVDPGLLEKVEGNNFRTRVYPILAGGTRTISIGYEEELMLEKEQLHYRLPMTYSNPIEKFTLRATVWKSDAKPLVSKSIDELHFDKSGDNYFASFTRENYRPARALNFSLPAPTDIPQVLMQSIDGHYCFLATVAPNLETRKKQWGNELAIIWDISLSAAQRDLKSETDLLNIIFAEKKDANVHIYFLNNKLKKVVNKNTAGGEYKVIDGNWNELKNVLETAVFDGGTDFSQINLNDITGNEILLFSDGISTLSDADFIKDARVNCPIHCVVSSAKTDYSAMRLISGKTTGKFVNLNALSSERLKNELLNETPQFLGTEHGKAIREIYPSIATPVYGNFSVAGISDTKNAEATLLFGFGGKIEKRITVKLDEKSIGSRVNVQKHWAQKKIAELDLNYEKNRAELTSLGRRFGIVTRNTSLIVLETVDDYVRYKIEPPTELREEYQRKLKTREERRGWMEHYMLLEAATAAKDIKKWWNKWNIAFMLKNSKSTQAQDYFEALPEERTARLVRHEEEPSSERSVHGNMDGGNPRARVTQMGVLGIVSGQIRGANNATEKNSSQPTITIKPIKKDNDYLNKLTGKNAEDYQLYLKLRTDYVNSPTFYFDMAEWFYTHGDKETALRVLTSIADLELENASLYRLLGYRLKEYSEYALEKFVCQKVILWRPMEPQSYRDYALALAENGETQAALDSLYGLLTKLYSENIDRRSHGIAEVAVTEINHLIAKNANLNTSKIAKDLIIKIPVDIRVVINWNMNNTDIDLHVTDPNNEECYYRQRETRIGGRISTDNISGYGPEQFLLKRAIKGKYKVCVNYYGDRQFTSAGPSTVMAEIFTKYADKSEQRRVVCLQMSKATKKESNFVEVAEFEF